LSKTIIRSASAAGKSTLNARFLSTYPVYVAATPSTEVTKIDNGVRVASETSTGDIATLGIYMDTGSRFETDGTSGVNHLLQTVNKKAVEGELGQLGAKLSVDAEREKTYYSTQVFKEDVPKAMEILGKMAGKTNFDSASVDAVKTELANAPPDLGKAVFEELHKTAFLDTPLGRPCGPCENQANLAAGDVSAYAKSLTADKFVVVGAGAVDHKSLVDLTSKHFGGLEGAAGKDALSSALEPCRFTGSDIRFRYDSMQNAHLTLAYKGVPSTSENVFPLMLMEAMIGTWRERGLTSLNGSGRMTIANSEHSFAHSYTPFNLTYKDTGLFGVYLVSPDNKCNDAMWYTTNCLVHMCHDITDEDIEVPKTKLINSILSNLSEKSNVASTIGNHMLMYGRRISPAEVVARIDALTKEDINATANLIVNDEDHAMAAIGAIYELPDYNWIRRRSFFQRY